MSDWSSSDPHSVNYIDTQSINDRGAPLSYNPSNMYDPTTPLGYLRFVQERERVQDIDNYPPSLTRTANVTLRQLALMSVLGVLGAIALSWIF